MNTEAYSKFNEDMFEGNYLIACVKCATDHTDLQKYRESFNNLTMCLNSPDRFHTKKQKFFIEKIIEKFNETFRMKIKELK